MQPFLQGFNISYIIKWQGSMSPFHKTNNAHYSVGHYVHYLYTSEWNPMKWWINYLDVIKRIPLSEQNPGETLPNGEGNGHFYHTEVRDLPFHGIPSVSCFACILLIENTRIGHFIWHIQNSGKHTMTMEDIYQVKMTLQPYMIYPISWGN